MFALATVPTIGDALEALAELCDSLSDAANRIRDLSKELVAKDHIRVDNINEVSVCLLCAFFLRMALSRSWMHSMSASCKL